MTSDTPIADMVERLAADGVPLTAIVIAIRTAEMMRHGASRDASRYVTSQDRTPAAIRAARYRENKRKNQHLAKANDIAPAVTQQRDGKRDASRDGVTIPCDDRKDLFNESDEGRKKKGDARARGTRLPKDWQPDADLVDFAKSQGVDPVRATAEFVDYWSGVPGSRGLKLDWPATFRNRVRELAGRQRGRQPARPQRSTFDDVIEQARGDFYDGK